MPNNQTNNQTNTPKRKASETRQLLFDACRRILIRNDLSQLTLDAVAEEAGLSKGGLLYHFPTKVALIEALIRHYNQQFDGRVEELLTSEPSAKGNYLRAYALASIEEVSVPDNASLFASLFAAGERYPSVLEIMRESYERWQSRVEASGLEPSTALLVRLAVDGLWFSYVYQYAPPTRDEAEEVIEYILRLTTE